MNRSVPTVGANIPEKCAAVSEEIMLKKKIERDSKKTNPTLVSPKNGNTTGCTLGSMGPV
jgi:hypothetical protein